MGGGAKWADEKGDAYANSGGLWTQSHAVNDEAAPKIESRE